MGFGSLAINQGKNEMVEQRERQGAEERRRGEAHRDVRGREKQMKESRAIQMSGTLRRNGKEFEFIRKSYKVQLN